MPSSVDPAAILGIISLNGLQLSVTFKEDTWRSKPQPISLNVSVHLANVRDAVEADSIESSINYSEMAGWIQEIAETEHLDARSFACTVIDAITKRAGTATVTRVCAEVVQSKACLLADFLATKVVAETPRFESATTFRIGGMESCIVIGISNWEKKHRQKIVLDVDVHDAGSIGNVVEKLYSFLNDSQFGTLEALANAAADFVKGAINEFAGNTSISIAVRKPKAVSMAESAMVTITKTFSGDQSSSLVRSGKDAKAVFIGIGSNMGDRASNIRLALVAMGRLSRVADTSFLYETEPMYETDQPLFLNCVAKIESDLEPLELLDRLQEIERELGRERTSHNAPRPIDLDILCWQADRTFRTADGRLIVPHQRLGERRFVLQPICDIDPSLLNRLQRTSLPLPRVMPVRGRLWHWGQRTFVMGILNVTPDSFSDGGRFVAVADAVDHVGKMIDAGVDIVDVGGQSTRPSAERVSVEEELRRVIPVIRAIRAISQDVPISIDTFHAQVAKEAVLAGADLINDVSGAQRDPRILDVAARLDVPICLMHCRGDAQTMLQHADYPPGEVLETVLGELMEAVEKAIKTGVPRWKIIVDPGIGFAKNADHNVELYRSLLARRGKGFGRFPLLLGPSRKRFIGRLTDKADPTQRGWGTASAVALSVAAGADIVRVHDVEEMVQVVRVADAMCR